MVSAIIPIPQFINKKTLYSWLELMVFYNMMGLGGRTLVLSPTIVTYINYDQFKYFSMRKCHHFERKARTLWSLLM